MESLVDCGRGGKESFAELDLNLLASKLEEEEEEREEGEEREKEHREEEDEEEKEEEEEEKKEKEEEKEKEPLVKREGYGNDREVALPLATRSPLQREEEEEEEGEERKEAVSPMKSQSPHLLPPSTLTEKKVVAIVRRRQSPSPPPPSRKVERAPHRERSRSASPLPERRHIIGRDHRRRSRSRTPPRRDSRSSRYSPRGRHSPMRRSSPARYRTTREQSPRRRPWSPPRNRNTGIGKPGKNLFVAGFSFSTTERDLEKKFSRFGRVTEVRIVRDKRSGESRGFGFLSLDTDEDADCAIRALDQTEWNGRVVLVEKAKTPGY